MWFVSTWTLQRTKQHFRYHLIQYFISLTLLTGVELSLYGIAFPRYYSFSVNDTTGSQSMTLRMLNISATNHSIAINDTFGSKFPHFPFDTPLAKGAKTTAYIVLLLLTLFGNVMVIHIIRRNPTLRSTVDLLIVNMCISDLLIPLFAIPYRIREIYVGNEWIDGDLGSILCKLVPFAMDVTTAVSILSMLAIAVERFRAVVYPTKPTLITVSRIRQVVAPIWALPSLTYSFYFYTFSNRETETKTYCFARWYQDKERHLKAEKIFFTSNIALLVIIPMLLITVLYTAVVVSLHRQKSRMTSHLSSEPLRRRAKQNRKITFMLITVVVVFASAYVPFGVLLLLSFYSPPTVQKFDSFLGFVSIFLVNVTSAVNPIIYFTFNDRFRQDLRKIICSNTVCQSYPGCRDSPVGDHGNNACAVVHHAVNDSVEMQKIGGVQWKRIESLFHY